MDIQKKIKSSFAGIANVIRPQSGYGFVTIYDDKIYKTTTPQYLYNLPFGYPRYVDVNEIRRLSKSPYVRMAIQVIIDEICAAKWDIVPRDEDTDPENHVNEVKDFFEDPNDNDESWEQVLRKILEDLLVLDAGALIKVFSRSGKFKEIYALDGGSINRNPNIHGNMAGRADIVSPYMDQSLFEKAKNPSEESKLTATYNTVIQQMENPPAYFQYGYANAARPVPLGRREVVYFMRNPNTHTHYGLSPVNVLMDIISMLIYGITHNLEYYTKDYLPKGILQSIGMTAEQCEAFSKKLENTMKYKDTAGNVVKKQWHIPVLGFDGKFVRMQYTNQELEMIQQQEWFTKLVWATFGITPSELGFTADSNRATEIGQSEVFRRKTIRPILNLIEYMINTQIVWQEFYDDVKFKFDMYDIKEDMMKHDLYEKQLRNRIKTPNEIRHELGLEPIEGGDELKQSNPFPSNPFGNPREQQENQDEYEMNVRENKSQQSLNNPLVPQNFEEMTPKKLEKEIIKTLKKNEKRIIGVVKESLPKADILRQIKSEDKILEKAFDQQAIKRIISILGLDSLRGMVRDVIRNQYHKGMEKAENEIGMNFMPDKATIDFLQNHAFDNVLDMSEEIKNDLRGELERGLMSSEGITKLSERIRKVFDSSETRAKAIARTETNRALNVGHVRSYETSGIKGKKRWVSQMDERTSEACKSLNGQEVELGDNFSYNDWSGPYPPQHVNCRSRIIMIPEK